MYLEAMGTIMVKNWQARGGSFSVARNWSPSQSPVAGDNLYIQSGMAVLAGQTFGSAGVQTTIGLTGASAAGAPTLALANVTLTNVKISEAPPAYIGPLSSAPSGYYNATYGTVTVAGKVVNDGGVIEGGRDFRLGTSLNVSLQPGSTLVNKGVLLADALSQLNVTGHSGSKLENDKTIYAAGGTVTVSAHLTGVGEVDVVNSGPGLSSEVELNAAVDAGQTFRIQRGVLQIDQPANFLGQVDLSGTPSGQVRVEGLSAASWDTKGSMLELFDAAGSRIDTLRFTTPQDPTKLLVYSAPDPAYGHAVTITPSFASIAPLSATVLPQHMPAV